MTDLNSIQPLPSSRFEKARLDAEDIIRRTVKRPDKAQYMGNGVAKYPPIIRNGALLALGFVALAMFWISAGKLLVSADMTLKPLIRDYADRLTPAWLNIAILVFLAGGEIGTLIFMVGRSIIARTVAERRWLALAALACAALAIVANISITALHPGDIQNIAVFGWLMAVIPPAIVLAVGIFIERLLIGSLEAWSEARQAYMEDYANWERIQAEPVIHPDFTRIWYLQILDQLMRISRANRQKIEAAIEITPEIRGFLIARELERNAWAESAQVAIEQTTISQNMQVLPAPANRSLLNTLNALNTDPPQLAKARAWLQENPTHGLSVRAAAEAAGVSIGIMHKAQQMERLNH